MYIQKCVCTFLIVLLYSYIDVIFKKNVQFLLGASKSEHFTGVYPCSSARMWRSERATPLKGNIEEMCERREARMRFSERIDTI